MTNTDEIYIPDYSGEQEYSLAEIREMQEQACVEIQDALHEEADDAACAIFGNLPHSDFSPTEIARLTQEMLSADGVNSPDIFPDFQVTEPDYDGTVDTPDGDNQDTQSDESPSTSLWEGMPADMAAWFDEPRFSECLSDDETGDNA